MPAPISAVYANAGLRPAAQTKLLGELPGAVFLGARDGAAPGVRSMLGIGRNCNCKRSRFHCTCKSMHHVLSSWVFGPVVVCPKPARSRRPTAVTAARSSPPRVPRCPRSRTDSVMSSSHSSLPNSIGGQGVEGRATSPRPPSLGGTWAIERSPARDGHSSRSRVEAARAEALITLTRSCNARRPTKVSQYPVIRARLVVSIPRLELRRRLPSTPGGADPESRRIPPSSHPAAPHSVVCNLR